MSISSLCHAASMPGISTSDASGFQPGCGQRLERRGEDGCREAMHFQYGDKSGSDDHVFIVDNQKVWR
jgi:hypothetical protein